MKTKYLKIVLSVLFFAIASYVFVVYVYNKPFKDILTSDAEFTFTTQSILEEFNQNEDIATNKYVDKIVQISGTINEISISNGNSIITLGNEMENSGVICQMLPKENLKTLKLKKGSQVMIKGICSGYLLDVNMIRCVIVKDEFDEK